MKNAVVKNPNRKMEKIKNAAGNAATKQKEKKVGLLGSISGATSVLGSWQVCHNICLGIIAVLGVLGIAVTGMPLLFLTKIAVPAWIVAASLLLITFILYYRKKCFSKNLLLFNSGLVTAGIPFPTFTAFQPALWAIGGLLSALGIILYLKERLKKKISNHEQ